jgi:hypothetical protein
MMGVLTHPQMLQVGPPSSRGRYDSYCHRVPISTERAQRYIRSYELVAVIGHVQMSISTS